MGTFKKGLLLGGLVGAGMTWLHTTVQGKKTKAQIAQHGADVYEQLMTEIKGSKGWKQLTKSEFVERATAIIDTYAVQTGLSDKLKHMIHTLVVSRWESFKKEQKNNSK
jgi:hypothetical protein